MSASYQIPGLGTLRRDSAGAWVIEGPGGDSRPLPPEYRLIADELDRWQRQNDVFGLAGAKLSPRVPSLWDGPLPGSRIHSFALVSEIGVGATSTIKTILHSGNLFIKCLSHTMLVAVSSWGPLTAGDGVIPLIVTHDGQEIFRLQSPTFNMQINVNLTIAPGETEFVVSNSSSSARSMNVLAEIWERTPRVKR